MFNSRNILYRNPVGAVPDGSGIHFKISMPRDLCCSSASLVVKDDSAGEQHPFSMFWCGMNGDTSEWWECDFVPETAGLYFYRFEVQTWRGKQILSKDVFGEGCWTEGNWWQITVYHHDFKTPEWLCGGIMYQIFPDRFCMSGEEKHNVPSDRRFHENWEELPQWGPDETGEITNKDYFKGDLKGITLKLDYLKSLGVSCIYLNPIFESHSNHRYDTADYSKIDPLLGNETDFRNLCYQANEMGIRVLIDGVFSHTGSDSVYFNREGRYQSKGAYNSQQSPYYSWYSFQHWPDKYQSWWGFITLPNVNETNEEYNKYINGKSGIVRKWLASNVSSRAGCGAAGWRLDVADELPDSFIDRLTAAAKAENPDAMVLGEVWEDASNKSAYGIRRRYLLGGQLDSVMNYPFRDAILGFLTGAEPADMMEIILTVLENYPPQVIRLLMNHIGTHDTERALTILAGEPVRGHARHWQSMTHLTKERRKIAVELLRLAALMQYTLPGVPCVYYGDEAGVEGYKDPFNRTCYPWGREDMDLLSWYRRLGSLRCGLQDVFAEGSFAPVTAGNNCMAYIRSGKERSVLVAVNACAEERLVSIASEWKTAQSWFGSLPETDLKLPAYGCTVLLLNHPNEKSEEKE